MIAASHITISTLSTAPCRRFDGQGEAGLCHGLQRQRLGLREPARGRPHHPGRQPADPQQSVQRLCLFAGHVSAGKSAVIEPQSVAVPAAPVKSAAANTPVITPAIPPQADDVPLPVSRPKRPAPPASGIGAARLSVSWLSDRSAQQLRPRAEDATQHDQHRTRAD